MNFSIARIPPFILEAGSLKKLPGILEKYGINVLLVTGETALKSSGKLDVLRDVLSEGGLRVHHIGFSGEPSTTFIDETVSSFRKEHIDAVLAVGGGSVVDAGKAISAMLPHVNSVMDHLEGVGKGVPHNGVKTPFVAVPTTAGTGSEMSKNAVISQVGVDGYKKSIRHDNFVPDTVVVDPELMLSIPSDVTAACGMDAFTQLLEAYVSSKANPFTDALAWSGLERVVLNLIPACGEGAGDLYVRTEMAYGAMMSGVVLANAGLGVVHGLASPIGGFFEIPHGVVCGTLMAAVVKKNVEKMKKVDPKNPALWKYSRLGAIMDGRAPDDYCFERGSSVLSKLLYDWTDQLEIPGLGEYGITEKDVDKIVQGAGNKNNPVTLTNEEIGEIVKERL